MFAARIDELRSRDVIERPDDDHGSVIETRPAVGPGGGRALLAAVRSRFGLKARAADVYMLPVDGGRGAFLSRSSSHRLVTVLDPAAALQRRPALRRWLERRQARRSAIVLAPDRATGVRAAQAWDLDLARIRVGDSGDGATVSSLCEELRRLSRRQRQWHERKSEPRPS
jgi:hypothetical protein